MGKHITTTTGKPATLRDVFDVTAALKWKGNRTERATMDRASEVIGMLERFGARTLDDVTSYHIADVVQEYRKRGCQPSTIRGYLAPLYSMSTVAQEHVPPLAFGRLPKHGVELQHVEKWWLTPDARDELLPWLRDTKGWHDVADYVEFVYFTGLRVEEALRLENHHFRGLGTETPALLVPGTKTVGAQATLAIGLVPAQIAHRRLADGPAGRLFPIRYQLLWERWRECRSHLGVRRVPTSTLKALRRSFAAVAEGKGMPTSALQRYFRHTNINTTIGYLKVVGSKDTEAMRKWL